MSNVNFRKTRHGYAAEYQRNDGFGYETRYFRRADVAEVAAKHGWSSPDESVLGEDWTIAEKLIIGGAVLPYRVAKG